MISNLDKMEKLDVNVSIKNVGSVSWDTYERYMIEAGEDLVTRIRWKYFHFKRNKRRKKPRNLELEENEDNVEEENVDVNEVEEDSSNMENSKSEWFGL